MSGVVCLLMVTGFPVAMLATLVGMQQVESLVDRRDRPPDTPAEARPAPATEPSIAGSPVSAGSAEPLAAPVSLTPPAPLGSPVPLAPPVSAASSAALAEVTSAATPTSLGLDDLGVAAPSRQEASNPRFV